MNLLVDNKIWVISLLLLLWMHEAWATRGEMPRSDERQWEDFYCGSICYITKSAASRRQKPKTKSAHYSGQSETPEWPGEQQHIQQWKTHSLLQLIAVYYLSGGRLFLRWKVLCSQEAKVWFCSSVFISLLLSPTSIWVALIAFILLCFALPHMAQPPVNLLCFLPISAPGRSTMEMQKERESEREREKENPQTSLFIPVNGNTGLVFMHHFASGCNQPNEENVSVSQLLFCLLSLSSDTSCKYDLHN